MQDEYGEKEWNTIVKYFNRWHYRGMIWQWIREDSNAARTTMIGLLWIEVWIGKLFLRLQWNIRMWDYIDRGFNMSCINRNDIKPALKMWLDDTFWDIVLKKRYGWWLKEDKWVLIWDTA